jgi:hypothetical protein
VDVLLTAASSCLALEIPKHIGKTTMPKRTRDYQNKLLEDLRDPAKAVAYLNAALADSEEMFLVALRDVLDYPVEPGLDSHKILDFG